MMARTRTLSPLFWEDADLALCSERARLLFLGLLNLADREGRLPDLAMWIKAKIFPYENVDAEKFLVELASERKFSTGTFITRYEAGDKKYIQINNFLKYQRPHPKEVPSDIPGPDLSTAGSNLAAASNGISGTDPSITSSPSVPSSPSSPSASSYSANGSPKPKKEEEITRAYLAVINALWGRRLTTLSPDVVKKVKARLKDWTPSEIVAAPVVIWLTHPEVQHQKHSPEVFLRDGENPKTRNGQTYGGYYWMSRAYEKAYGAEMTEVTQGIAKKIDQDYGLQTCAMLKKKGVVFL